MPETATHAAGIHNHHGHLTTQGPAVRVGIQDKTRAGRGGHSLHAAKGSADTQVHRGALVFGLKIYAPDLWKPHTHRLRQFGSRSYRVTGEETYSRPGSLLQ